TIIVRLFFDQRSPHCCLPSFPTRRSSDLALSTGFTSLAISTKSPVIAALPPPVGWKLIALAEPIGGGTSIPLSLIGSARDGRARSEEHTSELQSHLNLVCRLLLEKKKIIQ